MANRRKGTFNPRNNSKGYFNNPFHIRNDPDNRKKADLMMDLGGGGGGSSFKHQGRYDSQNNRFYPVPRGRQNRNKRGGRHRQLDSRPRSVISRDDGQPSWFKVTIPFGKKLQKNELLRSLMSCSQRDFIAINYQVSGHAALFYVDTQDVANALRQCSRRLTFPEGGKIQVHITTCPPPPTPLPEGNLLKIKVAMSNKFDTTTLNLDLHSFHSNPELRSEGLYAPLCRPHVLQAVIKVITSHIPQIRSLDLSGNKLLNLSGTSELLTVCKDLKSLTLKDNLIRSMVELNSLKGLGIEELVLDGNPLCDHYKDRSSYISDVRSKFPKVIKLDGQDLPAPILFDLGTTETLPPVKGSYFPSQELAGNVLQFLETYFGFYDSDNRQPLLDAYHEEAVYSLQVAKQPSKPQDSRFLSEYLYNQGNRNLYKVTDSASREKFLRQGKVAIVSQLCNLPKTQHFANSITVDVSHLSAALMMFTVSGLFKEFEANSNAMKGFTRNFLVVPHDQGILIINETHLVTSPTGAQLKAHRAANNPPSNQGSQINNPAPAAASLTAAPLTAAPLTASPVVPATEEMKTRIIMQMVNLSGMNVPYSTKCLEEQNWDLNGAMAIFTELNNRGGIPAEAFQAL